MSDRGNGSGGGSGSGGGWDGGQKREAPKRKGYQEVRRQDRDRRDNRKFKRPDCDGGGSDRSQDHYATGDAARSSTAVGDRPSKKDERVVKGNNVERGKADVKSKASIDQAAKLKEEEEIKTNKKEEERLAEESKQKAQEEAELAKKQAEQDALKKAAEDEVKSIQDFVAEINERHEFRASLREQNLVATDDRPDISTYGKLDSNLKKNTAFVKKLKNLTESQRESLIRDFNTLNLSKYMGEAATSITEAKLKMSDVACAVLICSLLHQRYADFSSALLHNWHKVLLNKKDEKVPNPSKLRVDLRLFADLISVGVFTEKVGLPVLSNQLLLLIANDKDEHNNLSILLSFCKHCGDDYAGLLPRKYRALAEKHGVEITRSDLLKEERKKACRTLIQGYYGSVATHLVSAHRQLRGLEKHNRKLMQTRGELSSERKEAQEAAQLAFSKLHTNAVTLSDLLDETLPELVEEEIKADEAGGLDIFCATDTEYQYDGDSSLFEDEDTRQFYEKFPDLRAIIPGILYKDSAKHKDAAASAAEPAAPPPAAAAAAAAAEEEEELDVEAVEREVEAAQQEEEEEEAPMEEEGGAVVEEEEEDIASSMKLIVDSFLASLPNCVNRELIDKAAIDFCMNMNTKTNRKKLCKTLFSVHRSRYDLLPFYARLAAVLHPVMPDVATDLAAMLKSDFKWHVRKKDQINIESKLKSVKFIGELTKFKLFSMDELFHCVKMLLFDFSHHNIEMACSLFDICGRFLYRSPLSHHRAKVYLDVMMRKKAALHLDARYVTLIENAYYYSNPPESRRRELERKQRPPMHQYVRRLLFRDLNKLNTEKIIRQLRKLDWDDAAIVSYVSKCLTVMTNVRYNVVQCVANLLAGLAPYHESMAIQVVDGVLEDIRLGMEINHPKLNQRRICMVRYLGELYNYRMVDSAVIFRTLYSFISYGVSLSESEPPSSLDPPEHLLRVRLCCVLIDSCGQYFDRGSSRKKLDCFITYFQRYYWLKRSNSVWNVELGRPFPMDMEYLVQDTLEAVRPKLRVAQSYTEAQEEAAKLDEEFRIKLADFLPKDTTMSGDVDIDTETLSTIQEDVGDVSDGLSQLSVRSGGGGGTTGGTQETEEDDEEEEDSDDQEGDEDDEDDMDEECSQDVKTASQSGGSLVGGLSQGGEGEEEDLDSDVDDDDDDDDDDEDEDEDGEGDVTLRTGGPKVIQCEEDDDFMSQFDKMLSDNIQHRSNEAVKVPQVDISVPLHLRSKVSACSKPGAVTTVQPGTLLPATDTTSPSPGPLNFMLLTRKHNKPQLSQLDVPVSAEIVARYKEREEQERAEKERMKRMVLDIHDRQEEEDYQEMLANLNRPMALSQTVRERKVKYQHPKGAPDADLIFGSKKK